jgi:hypothetical protein
LAIAGVRALSSSSNGRPSNRERFLFTFGSLTVKSDLMCIVVFVVPFFGLASSLFSF